MSPSERKAMINRNRTDLSLTKQCKLLKISRSSLYYTPVGVNAETLELMNEIDRVFTKYPFFGSRQIAAYLPRNGFHAGRHRVRRLIGMVIPPFLAGCDGRIHAAIFSFIAGVMPPMPIFGRSLL